jgi:hypothetical protein
MRGCERRQSVLVVAILLAMGAPVLAGPEIYLIDPESGPAGTPIRVSGKGLSSTGRVLFAVGRTIRRAQFKVVSDREIEVLAPEYYRSGEAATIVVFARQGAAVAMPATVQTVRSPVQGADAAQTGESFFHVLDGGILNEAHGVAVIEPGGVVVQSSEPPMQFVKRGGTLLAFRNGNGIVFYEPDAQLGPGVVRPNRPAPVTLVRVPEITACAGVGPFRFVSAAVPDLARARAVPPVIRGLSSRSAPAGAILTVTGEGFARAIDVRFLGPTGGSRSAGFRVVSDRELRVEVPDADDKTSPQLLAVLTSQGLAVTVPRNKTVRPAVAAQFRRNAARLPAAVLWISAGDVIGAVASQSIIISPGGMATQAEANRVYFVQHDGRLGDSGQNPKAVYYEPGAILPDRLKQAPIGQSVPVIVPCPVDTPFYILRAPDVRG